MLCISNINIHCNLELGLCFGLQTSILVLSHSSISVVYTESTNVVFHCASKLNCKFEANLMKSHQEPIKLYA